MLLSKHQLRQIKQNEQATIRTSDLLSIQNPISSTAFALSHISWLIVVVVNQVTTMQSLRCPWSQGGRNKSSRIQQDPYKKILDAEDVDSSAILSWPRIYGRIEYLSSQVTLSFWEGRDLLSRNRRTYIPEHGDPMTCYLTTVHLRTIQVRRYFRCSKYLIKGVCRSKDDETDSRLAILPV